jgi:phosphohistidine phosphatase
MLPSQWGVCIAAMLRLMLLRHAKSSSAADGLDDRERPLTRRGERAAQAMGRFMTANALLPDLVLCSPARRARDTWKLAAEEFKAAPRLIVEEPLYDFGGGDRLIDVIRAGGAKSATLLLIGHNPSIERAALRLSAKGDRRLKDRMQAKYPAGALAVIAFSIAEWTQLAGNEGELLHFIRPRDIMTESAD